MKRSHKFSILIIMIIVIFLAGCNKLSFDFLRGTEDNTSSDSSGSMENIENTEIKDETESESSSVLASSAEEEEEDEDEASSTDSEAPTVAPIQPSANMDVPIYIVNSETADIEPVTAVLPQDSEITPELIVNIVIQSMADHEIHLATDKVSTEGKAVIVSFVKDRSPASDMGSGYEIAILDAITLSLTENLKDYDQVIYRLEGEAYQSGHIELGIDEVWR